MKSLLFVLSFAVAPLLSQIAEARGIACLSGDLRCGGGGGGGPRPAPVAIASEVPTGAPEKLSDPNLYKRCDEKPQTDEEVKGCIDLTRTTTARCLTDSERQWAIDHALGVVCVGERLHSACPCSCFDQSTRILSINDAGDPAWKNVLEIKKGSQVFSLAESSKIDKLEYAANNVSYQTSGPEKKALVVIKTDRNILKVTEKHAILLADGRVVAAQDVREGDKVMGTNGKPKKVTAVESEYTDKDVINFLVDKPVIHKKNHIVGAEGILVGDMQWQNYLRSDLNKVLLRR